MTIRETVLAAIEKDIYRRYISVVSLQADGRLELDSSCLAILSPKQGEEFSIINDKSSIIITRSPIEEHKDKVISKIAYGSGKGNIRWRLRLPLESLRILLTCKVGFKAFRYGKEIALEVEPFIPPTNPYLKDAKIIEDLAPHILRSSRSILHIHCISENQKLFPEELGFRILGDFWKIKYHYNPLTASKIICTGSKECVACLEQFFINKTDYWFPAIGYHYQQHYARPTLISFNNPVSTPLARILAPLYKDCRVCQKRIKKKKIKGNYCSNGLISYHGKKLYKISCGDSINIDLIKKDAGFTKEEKGLMKLSHKEILSFIKNNYPGGE